MHENRLSMWENVLGSCRLPIPVSRRRTLIVGIGAGLIPFILHRICFNPRQLDETSQEERSLWRDTTRVPGRKA
jgi:hypothetical protein